MELQDIPLDHLTVAKLNARTHGATEQLDTLAASIRAQGVLQPLLVRSVAGGDRFEIVAGQRRFLACQRLAQETAVGPLPCLVLAATDDAAALEISLAENLERLPMEPFDQHEAFAKLVKLGQRVETIAARFGVTERLVKQRLALAGLIEPIKREVRQGAVDLADAQRLALATPKQQREWMKRYRDSEQYAPQGSQLKAWLCGGAAIATEVALFPLESYRGRIVADLFGEQAYFDDAAQFWTLQNQAIAERRDQLRAVGWARVEVLEIGDYFRSWEYQRTGKDAGGWVLILPQENGEVGVHAGYLPLKEAHRQARAAAGLAADVTDAAPKAIWSETTQALQNYVALHKAAAVRCGLTQHPAIALRLAVACLIGNATNGSVRADRTPPHGAAIEASVAAGAARAAFAEERRTVASWLGEAADGPEPADAPLAGRGRGERQTARWFSRLLELSDAQVLKALAVVTAETLVAGSGLAERLGELLQIDLRAHWQPDETFFDLLTDKDALVRIAAEVGAAPAAKATGKELRGLIRRRLRGEGCPPVANWLPRYCEFPSRGYTGRPVSEARAAYDRLARDGNGDGNSAAVADGAGEITTAGRTEEAGEDEPQAAVAFDRAA
jgi:ParB family chromosome partitioning protein